ncbi:MAG: hypothetical protein ACI8WT_002276 [Clostridium sp.]|jgi:hypothetical protein
MGFDNRNLKEYSYYYNNDFKIQLSNNIQTNDEDIIIVDIEKILFIQNLIVNGIGVKMI